MTFILSDSQLPLPAASSRRVNVFVSTTVTSQTDVARIRTFQFRFGMSSIRKPVDENKYVNCNRQS
jgi:hypothetical protein